MIRETWFIAALCLQYLQVHAAPNLYVVGGRTQDNVCQNYVQAIANLGDQFENVTYFAMKQPRVAGGAATYQGSLYIIGGSNCDKTQKSYSMVQKFNGFRWNDSIELTTGREWGQFSPTSNGKIYAVGGLTEDSVDTNQVEYFDGTSWHKGPSLPNIIRSHALVEWNDRLYSIGGYDEGHGAYDDVFYLELNGTAWQQGPSLPYSVLGHSAAVYNQNLYVIGGLVANDYVTNKVVYLSYRKPNTWQYAASMNQIRSSFGIVWFQGYLVALGGNLNKEPREYVSSVEYFDGYNWHQHPPMLAPLSDVQVGVL